MSRTNENKLKMKDIATIGIFSALLFVVTMVAGALMGISMVLNMYSVAVVAVLSAPLYMLVKNNSALSERGRIDHFKKSCFASLSKVILYKAIPS